jgi:DNA polymerase-1
MPDSSPRLIVIDVMPILYRGHFALMRRPRLTSSGFNTSALFVFTNIVRDLLANRGATHAALVMDTSPTFRHELYPEYKAQREKLPEDIAASLEPAEAFARAIRVPFLRVEGFEADDLMGTLAARAEAAGFETWVVSPDKDMAQLVTDRVTLCRPSHVPGEKDELYDPARVREEWGLDSPAQMVDLLGMAGDSSDNIPGFPGIGPKTASTLLKKYGSIEGVIAHASEIKGKTGENIAANAEIARLSRRLAEIRRDAPIAESLDDLALHEPDRPALESFCRQYELNSLLRRYYPDAAPEPAAPPPASGGSGTEPPFVGDEPAPPPLATAATTPHTYRLVRTAEDLAALAAELAAAPEFAFDTETTGLDPRHDRCVGMSFSTKEGTGWYIPLAGPAGGSGAEPPSAGDAQPDLFSLAAESNAPAPSTPAPKAAQGDLFDFFGATETAPPAPEPAPAEPAPGLSAAEVREALGPAFASSKTKCAHNAKFDIHVLRALGIEVAPPIADSMLAHYVLDPTQRHGMDPLSREFLRYDPIPIESLIGPRGKGQLTMDQVPAERVAEYAAEDADVTLRLHRALEPVVRDRGAWRAYDEAENPLVPVLVDMEDAGIRIDTDALARYSGVLAQELAGLVARIHELAGGPFNIDSPQQLGRVLFEGLKLPAAAKTSTGHWSTAEDVLQGLAGEHEIVPAILDYRAVSKLKSTYVDKLPQCIDPRDGRVHTTFQQALTETGRLSSDNPNLQNIPVRTDRGKPIRAAFVAGGEGHVLVSADYSQIELRMMAALSGDETMIDAFRHDADIHAATAARVYGIDEKDVTREQRSHCKQVSFGIIYGISAFGLAQRLGIARHMADGLIKAYFEMFPGVRRFMDSTIARARADGYVTTILGRRRPLRDIVSRNATVRSAAERNAVNTPVQGSAADLVKLAMVRVHAALRERNLRSRLVLQIHDELLLDCPAAEVAEVSALVKDAMENALPLAVPLKVDVGSGANWLAAH